MNRSATNIVKAARRVEHYKKFLNETAEPLAVVFIDLAGSTQLKYGREQSQWLPVVVEFLTLVSQCVKRHEGRVVKYIGDEVFAVFENGTADENARRVISFVQDCEKILSQNKEYSAKYTADIGRPAMLQFKGSAPDLLGTCVDRASRISKLSQPHCLIVSDAFAKASPEHNWRKLGSFTFKGIKKRVPVFQLENLGPSIKILDLERITRAADELIGEIRTLETNLGHCKNRLDALRGVKR